MNLVISYMPVDSHESYSDPLVVKFGFDFLRQLILSETHLNGGIFLREDLFSTILEMISISRASLSQWRQVKRTHTNKLSNVL